MRKFPVLLLAAFVLPLKPALSQEKAPISYQISWRQPNSHLFDISLTVENLNNENMEFRIPAWRPGRYYMQNYARNVMAFQAFDELQRPLSSTKIDKDTWRVQSAQAARVVVKYQYYARQLDGGASYLDDSEAYINPITLLMYIPGQELSPVRLQIEKPSDWRVATALNTDASEKAFFSESYHELVDAPILISPNFMLLSFEDKGAQYDLVFQGDVDFDQKKVVEDVHKIVAEQTRFMQIVPFKRYVFLYHLVPFRMGHGVEHKYSTSIVMGPADFENEKFYNGFLSVTSHEFFHVWNVERIRPQAIYLPDYSKEAYTTTMWDYEGFTSYYGGLTLVRAKLKKRDKYFEDLAKAIKSLQNAFGRKITSVAMSSWDSWTKGYGHAPPNSSVSFYGKGALLGLLLDLEVRQRTKNHKSLDDVLRFLYDTYAAHNRGVPEDGLQQALTSVAGGSYDQFFADYVFGTEEIDYNRFLAYAGLQLTEEQDEKQPSAYLGIKTAGDTKECKVTNVLPETPAYHAGLDVGDVLLAFDTKRTRQNSWKKMLKKYAPGDTITVTVFRRNVLRNFRVGLESGGNSKFAIKELDKVSKLQKRIRKSWLNEQ
ncbi:MAG: M61 family metallopeptidase [bacterium]